MSPLVSGLVAVAVVALLAVLLRQRAASAPPPAMRPEPPVDDAPEPEDESFDDDPDGRVVAVTSDGCALVPFRRAVRLLAPEEEGEAWKTGAGLRDASQRGAAALAMSWHAGDFTGARVVRDPAGSGGWCLEALGRDGEYEPFTFETREGADAALALFTDLGVVRSGDDQAPPSAEQFDEARRRHEAIEAELALDDVEERP